jgi:hypothetical protein
LLNTLLTLRLASDAFHRFASEWGLLGIARASDHRPLAPGPPEGIESIDDWIDAVQTLQLTFQLWSAVQNNDRETMRLALEAPQKNNDTSY